MTRAAPVKSEPCEGYLSSKATSSGDRTVNQNNTYAGPFKHERGESNEVRIDNEYAN